MNKNLEDFAKDLAIEIEVGGDRFDRLDMAFFLYSSGLKPEGVEDFRKLVASKVHEECCSKDFLQQELDYWLPDWVCELGEFEHRREDNHILCDGVMRLSSEVFACFWSKGLEHGDHAFYGKDAVALHRGVIPTYLEEKKNGSHVMRPGFFVFDNEVYAFSREIDKPDSFKDGLIKVDLKTAEVEKHVFTPASDISIDYIQKSELCPEVLRSAFDHLSEFPHCDINDALRVGMKEWDIKPGNSMKI